MATADQIKSLIKAHLDGNDEKFKTVVLQIAAYEAKKNHVNLAQELKKLIDKPRITRASIIPITQSNPMLQMSLPNQNLHDLIVSDKIYEKLAYRGTSEGIIGVYKSETKSLENFVLTNNCSIIIIEGVEKPGNLGAILRSCEAFGIDALIVTDPKIDFYNPNVIRSSVGCLFGMNFFQSSNEELFEFLKVNNFEIFTTMMDESAVDLYLLDFKTNSALLFGTEHSGLSDFWLEKGKNTLIPMSGSIDSLNLSNAVAIGCYEILRQKLQ